MFTDDLSKIDILTNRPFETSNITFSPNISVLDPTWKKKQYYRYEKEMKIYVDNSAEKIKNLVFYWRYEIEKENEVQYIQNQIKFI